MQLGRPGSGSYSLEGRFVPVGTPDRQECNIIRGDMVWDGGRAGSRRETARTNPTRVPRPGARRDPGRRRRETARTNPTPVARPEGRRAPGAGRETARTNPAAVAPARARRHPG